MLPPDRLHRDLKLKRPNPLWAKTEVLLGLFAAAIGLVSGMKLAVLPGVVALLWTWVWPVVLIARGGYLALAGHRSHLYQSNNRLVAHLTELVRGQQPQKPEKPS